MEDITHVTRQGSKPFTLSSTNKLLKQYPWATGLKTGSTSTAKYCFSATANKDGIDMIAVVMGAPDFKVRFAEAKSLLEYGFAMTRLYVDENREPLETVKVAGGKETQVAVVPEGEFRYLDTSGADFSQIIKTYEYRDDLSAPFEQGEEAGRIRYTLNGQELGSVAMLTVQSVERAGIWDYLYRVYKLYLL